MNINITLFGQMITFAIFVWFTMRFVWPPIMAAMEERAAKIAQGITDAEQAENTLSDARSEAEGIITAAKKQAQDIIKDAKQSADELIKHTKERAQDQHDLIVARAAESCEQQLSEAKQVLMQDVASLVIQGSEKILGREINNKQNTAFVDRFIEEHADG